MATCPYNSSHIMDYALLPAHIQTCPSRHGDHHPQYNYWAAGLDGNREENLNRGFHNQVVPYQEKNVTGGSESQVHVHTHVHNHFHYAKPGDEDADIPPRAPSQDDGWHGKQSPAGYDYRPPTQTPSFSNQQNPQYQPPQPQDANDWAKFHSSKPPQAQQPPQEPNFVPTVPAWSMDYFGGVHRRTSAFKPVHTKNWHDQEAEFFNQTRPELALSEQVQPPPQRTVNKSSWDVAGKSGENPWSQRSDQQPRGTQSGQQLWAVQDWKQPQPHSVWPQPQPRQQQHQSGRSRKQSDQSNAWREWKGNRGRNSSRQINNRETPQYSQSRPQQYAQLQQPYQPQSQPQQHAQSVATNPPQPQSSLQSSEQLLSGELEELTSELEGLQTLYTRAKSNQVIALTSANQLDEDEQYWVNNIHEIELDIKELNDKIKALLA